MINKISREKLVEISNASAKILPDNPTGRGMTADEIRKRLWEPIVSKGNSLAEEIDRVVDEANTDLGNLEIEIKDEASARKSADDNQATRISTLEQTASNLQHQINGKVNSSDVNVDAAKMTIAKRSAVGTLHAITTKTVGGMDDSLKETMLVNLGFFDAEMGAHKADADNAYAPKKSTEAAFGALFSAVDGLTNSYVADDVNAIQGFLDNGYWEIAGVTYYAERMQTGDNIFVVDSGCPDFWFEKTSDMGRIPEKITITLDDESTVTLTLRVYFNGNLVGLLHILESDNVNLGDLDRVLDSIIAYQNQLIGGDA